MSFPDILIINYKDTYYTSPSCILNVVTDSRDLIYLERMYKRVTCLFESRRVLAFASDEFINNRTRTKRARHSLRVNTIRIIITPYNSLLSSPNSCLYDPPSNMSLVHRRFASDTAEAIYYVTRLGI